jgi:hypothetical protein
MLLLPGVVTMVRDTLKAPGFKYTQMIGQSLGAGTNMARQGQALVKKSLWKENRVTGKPEGVKKWVQGNLGKNTFGLLGRGIPGRAGASIGSRFSNQKLQKRAQTFQTQNQAKQIVNTVQRIAVGTGLSKNDPNRANTIYGLEARPVGDGKVEFTLPDGKTVTKGGLVDNLWDPKPTEEGGTPPLTPERRDEVARESTLPPELQNFIEEDKGDLTEDEISEIGKIIRDELNKDENKIRDIKHITTEEEARIRSLRDAAKEQVIKARILPHRPTTNDGTIATDGSHKDDASPSD